MSWQLALDSYKLLCEVGHFKKKRKEKCKLWELFLEGVICFGLRCALEAEFSGGWLGFSPLEIFSSVFGGGDKYLEFLAYFPEFRKNTIKTFSPHSKNRTAHKTCKVSFLQRNQPKVG